MRDDDHADLTARREARYGINFNRHFYRHTPPRPMEEIEADSGGIEQDIMRMLAEVTGSLEV